MQIILHMIQPSRMSLRFLIKDALDELNGRQYDGRELRIKIDEGRPK